MWMRSVMLGEVGMFIFLRNMQPKRKQAAETNMCEESKVCAEFFPTSRRCLNRQQKRQRLLDVSIRPYHNRRIQLVRKRLVLLDSMVIETVGAVFLFCFFKLKR